MWTFTYSNEIMQTRWGSWENFSESIRSEYTRFDYSRKLKFFLAFVKCDAREQRDRVAAREITAIHLRKVFDDVSADLLLDDSGLRLVLPGIAFRSAWISKRMKGPITKNKA